MKNTIVIVILHLFVLFIISSCSGRAPQTNITKTIIDFGAVGDGITDDTQALKAGLYWLSVSGGTLIFPGGTYKVESELDLPLFKDATLISQNESTVTIIMESSESNVARAILNVFGTRTKVGTLNENANKSSSFLSGNFPEVNPDDELILVTDKPDLADAILSFSNIEASSRTTLISSKEFFTPQMKGQSIVFPIYNNIIYNDNPESSNPIIKLDEPLLGATAVITEYISPTEAVAIVGNNNDIPTRVFAPNQWGITNLWNKARGYYVKGEIVKVASTSQEQLTVSKPLMDNYTKGNTNVYKISNARFSISGINFKAAKPGLTKRRYAADYGIVLNDLASFSINNSGVYNLNRTGIFINECGNGLLNDITVNNIMKLNSRYGLLIAQSQNITLNHSNLSSGSHAFASGGTFPNRNIVIANTTINDDSDDYAFDFHGNTSNVLIDNVRSLGGFVYSGANLRVRNSTFMASNNKPGGFAAIAVTLYPEVSGDYFEFNNSTVMSNWLYSLFIVPAFIDIPTQGNLSDPYGTIKLIAVNNSQIINSKIKFGGALTMYSNRSLPVNMNFTNLLINNSLITASDTAGINLEYKNPVSLNLNNFKISNNSSIISNTVNSVYVDLGAHIENNYQTRMLVQKSNLIAYGKVAVNLNNINSITIWNSRLNGSNQNQFMQILGFNRLQLLGNSFINWRKVRSATAKIDAQTADAITDYKDNLIIKQ